MVANFDRDFSPEKDDTGGSNVAAAAHESVMSEIAGDITRRPERNRSVKTLEFAPGGFDMTRQIDFSKAYVPDWLVKEKV